MSVYCTLPRCGGSYYHSSLQSAHSPSSPSSSSSTLTNDSASLLNRTSSLSVASTTTTSATSASTTGTSSLPRSYFQSISNQQNQHSFQPPNPRYQHQQSIKTMFNTLDTCYNINNNVDNRNPPSLPDESFLSSSNNSLIGNNAHKNPLLYQQQQPPHHLLQRQQDYHDYQAHYQPFEPKFDLSSSNGKNFFPSESTSTPTTPVSTNSQGNQLNNHPPNNQLIGLSSGLPRNMCNSNNNSGSGPGSHASYQQQQPINNPSTGNQRSSLHLTLTRPPEPPQRIYYGLDNFDDLKAIRRNSITSLTTNEDPTTPNFYGDEDSAYDSTSNESLRLTVKELSKRSNSKKYFTLPTKLGRRLRKSSCPEFANAVQIAATNHTNPTNHPNRGTNSLTPSPVSDCSPSPALIFNGPTFPSSSRSMPTTSSSSTSSSIISSSSSASPPSTISSLSSASSSSSSSPTTDISSLSMSATLLLPMVTNEMSSHQHQIQPNQHPPHAHVDNCSNYQQQQHANLPSLPLPPLTTTTPTSPSDPNPVTSANENVCHCCYLLGCHQNSPMNPNPHVHHQQHGRVTSGGSTISTNNNPQQQQPSTLETLWEEPASGHENHSVRLTEEAIYAAMRELNISLPATTKGPVNGQANRNSSGWLRGNFLKAFRRSSSSSSSTSSSSASSKNRSSKLMASETGSLDSEPDGSSSNKGSLGSSAEAGNKRSSMASSLSSLPISSSPAPPTPPLTPLPSYQSVQFHPHPNHVGQHYHNSGHPPGSEEKIIRELNQQLAEKDQLLQEVCMESINHLNTIENLKEVITQLRQEIDSLKTQNPSQATIMKTVP